MVFENLGVHWFRRGMRDSDSMPRISVGLVKHPVKNNRKRLFLLNGCLNKGGRLVDWLAFTG